MLAVHATLKKRHRATREGMPEALNLRVHRALSWIKRAAISDPDPDARFIFLWIAFNAAYAQEIPTSLRLSEHQNFQHFLQKLHQLDADKQLDHLVWEEFSGPIRVLLDNPYVFESFWDYHRGILTEPEWMERFARGKQRALILLAKGHTPDLLGLVLQRIYTLRNQIIHGGATWNSKTNRAQVQDCAHFMSKLVPVVLDIMLSHPTAAWGDACYPVVE